MYNLHRQTLPIIKEARNRAKYIFLEMSSIWRLIPFKSTNKAKYRIMYWVLCLLGPKYIIDINWISPYQGLYKVWTNNNGTSQFIVIQHGSYMGGIVSDIAHRYTKCDVFLTWSDYFTKLFKNYNIGKNVKILSFGNTIYNQHDRNKYSYIERRNGKILLAPSGIKGPRLEALHYLHKRLEELGFRVHLKEHRFQSQEYQKIVIMPKINGDVIEALKGQFYDIIITDHSSLLLDAIMFKNKVLFFSAPGESKSYLNNYYTYHLKNIFYDLLGILNPEDIYNLVDIESQENLFKNMILINNNKMELE